MITFDSKRVSNEMLQDYDAMMLEAVLKIDKFSGLATSVWIDVLKELDARGKVTLFSGSYDDVGNALITRNY